VTLLLAPVKVSTLWTVPRSRYALCRVERDEVGSREVLTIPSPTLQLGDTLPWRNVEQLRTLRLQILKLALLVVCQRALLASISEGQSPPVLVKCEGAVPSAWRYVRRHLELLLPGRRGIRAQPFRRPRSRLFQAGDPGGYAFVALEIRHVVPVISESSGRNVFPPSRMVFALALGRTPGPRRKRLGRRTDEASEGSGSRLQR
jgi:hypothetical protein